MAQLARDFPGHSVVVEVILKGQWKTLLGERVGSNSVPASYRDGVLEVAASDDRWLEELSRLGEEIRGRLNAFFGQEIIRQIHFVRKI